MSESVYPLRYAARRIKRPRIDGAGMVHGVSVISAPEDRVGSVLAKQVNYLLKNSYRWANNDMSLIPK
jgi:hypothetical protein